MSTNQNQQTIVIPIKSIAKNTLNNHPKTTAVKDVAVTVQTQQVLAQAKKQADYLIKEAEQMKQKMMNDLLKELETTKEIAYQDGYKEGYLSGIQMGKKDGKKQVISESRQCLDNCRDEWLKTQSDVESYLESVQPMIANVIKDSIETIMMQKLQDGTLSILPIICEMLQQLSKRKQIFIRVHPARVEEVKIAKKELEEICENSSIKIYEDMSLSDYGCLIETESEKIDLQLDKQLNQLFTELKQLVG